MQKLRRSSLVAMRAAIMVALCSGFSNIVTVPRAASQDLEVGAREDLCPSGASDRDGDTICDVAEERLYGTNPDEADTDADALDDAAEILGLMIDDVDGDGKPELLNLPELGANPRHKDVFVEIDYYPGHEPRPDALERVKLAFYEAPVDNPDGATGIHLHLLVDDKIAPGDVIPVLGKLVGGRLVGHYDDFKTLKRKYADPVRHAAYHYALYANQTADPWVGGDAFHIGGHDFVLTMGPAPTPDYEATTFMHELGHNLALFHGGHENENDKPNYLSIMNYLYSESGLMRDRNWTLDYSRHPTFPIAEGLVDELGALLPAVGGSEDDLARYTVYIRSPFGFAVPLSGNASENLDWNNNGTIETEWYAWDLNGDGDAHDSFAASQNDWDVLEYHSAGTIGIPLSWHGYLTSDDEPTHPPCALPRAAEMPLE